MSAGRRRETWPEFLQHLRRQGHSGDIIEFVERWVKDQPTPDEPTDTT